MNPSTDRVYVSIAKDGTVYVIADVLAISTGAPDEGPTSTATPTPTLTTAQRDLLSVAEAYYDTFNAGDIETLTTILADDIIMSDLPPFGTMDKLAWLAAHAPSFVFNDLARSWFLESP